MWQRLLIAAQDVQLYLYIVWAVADSLVTAGFIHHLHTKLISLRIARWHVISLTARSLAIIVLAIIGITHKDRLTREAQVDVAMAASVCFLVVKAFGSLVFSGTSSTVPYSSRYGTNQSAGRTSIEHPTNSSQERINVVQELYSSDDKLDVMEGPRGVESSRNQRRNSERSMQFRRDERAHITSSARHYIDGEDDASLDSGHSRATIGTYLQRRLRAL
ncbi:uncharacterized protein LTR77_005906 [Saxophila tyrrhenica]|uniref:Uncharacterized protein n=1 Tax=Saxophila tyrrhenica TaxID=1690608 RepID=A0AAV9P9V9_9PEZI|nr:hypothetical protein LTR77_005906 [Saxophila tyrrhenica]